MRNAFTGYTYQQQITRLLVAKMDAEREISRIMIEAKTLDNFDDIILAVESEQYHFQIKDFVSPKLDNIVVRENECLINGKAHKLSPHVNVIFFKEIEILANSEVLGFPAQFIEGVYVVSLSRSEVNIEINKIYNQNSQRLVEIDAYFNKILDNRIWDISRKDLPSVTTYDTELLEETVDVGPSILEFEKLLLIEGKPGVGKSHLSKLLVNKYDDTLLYKFWIRNQDPDYRARLMYENFLKDLSKKVFGDYKVRSLLEISEGLKDDCSVLIVDGFDHVENYNPDDLLLFIKGFNFLKDYCKIIILSRPLVTVIECKKQTMTNWNSTQTKRVLNELFHLNDYELQDSIFEISQGYPILVRYLAEHYKIHHRIPELSQLKDINDYYEQILKNEKGLQGLTLFLCSSSYFMESEIKLFLEDSAYLIEEYVKEHPYLFEKRLNRISLFHDSLNTYLKSLKNVNSNLNEKVQSIVFDSIMSLDRRFISRFSLFNLSYKQKVTIVRKVADLSAYQLLVKDCIDYEALQSFYTEVKLFVSKMNFKDLETIQYYDLSLIENLINRDHVSALHGFNYIYLQSLLGNGYSQEDISSSRYLFAMLYYILEKNPILLYNRTNDDLYSTTNFTRNLQSEITEEIGLIQSHHKKISIEEINSRLLDKLNLRDHFTYIIESFYIHNYYYDEYYDLYDAVIKYLNGNENVGIYNLTIFLKNFEVPDYYSRWILKDVKNNLLAYGIQLPNEINIYTEFSLRNVILENKSLGSFELKDIIQNYIRLALHQSRNIDIESIHLFWTKYYQRRDYSLFSIPRALYVLESKSLLTKVKCIEIIHHMQSISEKEHRGLLFDFIKFYAPQEIITVIEDNFDTKELIIDWFQLPSEYLNWISFTTYKQELVEMLQYHRSHPKIKIRDVEGLVSSKWFGDFEFQLKFPSYSIVIDECHPLFEKIRSSSIRYVLDEEKISNKKNKDIKDSEPIRINYSTPTDLVKESHYRGTSFSDPNMFSDFSSRDISQNFQEILFNGITYLHTDDKYPPSLFYWPGNVLSLINSHLNEDESIKAAKSFELFMQLSLFTLELKN